MFVYRATKHYEELWRVEERALLGHLRRLRAQAASKTVLEQIRRNPLWKRKIMSQEPNILIQSKSHFIRDDQHMTVYTSQRDTSSLLLWRQSDGQEQSTSSSGVGIKHPFHDERIFSISRSSTTTRTTRFMLKSPMRWRKMFWGCTEAITLPTSWFGRRCPNRWWQIFIFAKKGVKLVSKCQEDVLQGVVKHLKMTLFSGLEWVFQH